VAAEWLGWCASPGSGQRKIEAVTSLAPGDEGLGGSARGGVRIIPFAQSTDAK